MGDASPVIRPMQAADLDEIMTIEKASFVSPWSRESFANDLGRGDAVSLVLVYQRLIAGYLVAWKIMDEIHIGNVAIHPDHRRKGFARDLITHLLLSHPDLNWAWLEVRQSNEAAKNLYQDLGFSEISTRKNYYQAENEDAIVMAKALRTFDE